MEAFTRLTSSLMPLDRSNVDTDAIIPKQYLKSIRKSGFGPNLFDDWRYLDPGKPDQDNSMRRSNPNFVLNDKRFKDARILLTRENFGCGSSREHAVWALLDFGFKVVIASSYADIFFSNSFKNGLLAIILDKELIETLFVACTANPNYKVTVNLEQQQVITEDNIRGKFEIDEFKKYCLLNGLDEIDLTLQYADKIRDYERALRKSSPWLFIRD